MQSGLPDSTLHALAPTGMLVMVLAALTVGKRPLALRTTLMGGLHATQRATPAGRATTGAALGAARRPCSLEGPWLTLKALLSILICLQVVIASEMKGRGEFQITEFGCKQVRMSAK